MYPVQRKVIVPCILHDHSPPTQSLGRICLATPAGSSEIDYLEQCKPNILIFIAQAFFMMLMRMYMGNIMQSEQRFLISTNLCQLPTLQNRNLPVKSPTSESVRQVKPENGPLNKMKL